MKRVCQDECITDWTAIRANTKPREQIQLHRACPKSMLNLLVPPASAESTSVAIEKSILRCLRISTMKPSWPRAGRNRHVERCDDHSFAKMRPMTTKMIVDGGVMMQ